MRPTEKSVCQRFVKSRNGGIDEPSTESALYEGIPGGGSQARRGVGASEASRRLSIPLKSLANWQRAAKAGKLEELGRQQKPQTELEAELQRTKRELAEVKMERDLLTLLCQVGR